MVARLQRSFTCCALIFSVAWIGVFYSLDRPALAMGGMLLSVAGYAVLFGAEFVMLTCVARADTPTAAVKDLLLAWISEVLIAPRVFCWRQPFRSNAEPDYFATRGQKGRGVVLLHGLWCNRGFWNPWMTQLRARDIPFAAVNLEPVYCSIDSYLTTVGNAVLSMQMATGMAPIIVGHSMGGLVARAWMSSSAECASRVHHLITIGTPHHGTWLARFSHSINGKEMRLDSPWLAKLRGRESALEQPYQRMTCFYSDCDNIVFPKSTATLPGADNRLLAGKAHVQLAFRSEVFAVVCERVRI